jgi:hypothetical protein
MIPTKLSATKSVVGFTCADSNMAAKKFGKAIRRSLAVLWKALLAGKQIPSPKLAVLGGV